LWWKKVVLGQVIRFVIPIVFIIKLDWGVCTCLTHLYDGRVIYRIYYIKNLPTVHNPHNSSIAAY
jgi:hypothetical protein